MNYQSTLTSRIAGKISSDLTRREADPISALASCPPVVLLLLPAVSQSVHIQSYRRVVRGGFEIETSLGLRRTENSLVSNCDTFPTRPAPCG